MKNDVVDAVSQLLRDKGIDKDTFEEIIQSVFLSMIKKKFNTSDNFDVTFNVDKGDIEIQCYKEVVADDEVSDPVTEIALSEAQKEDPEVEVGEEMVALIAYEKEFGRRIIIAAKQHLMQRIREIEKDNLYNDFSQRIGEIVIADIHHITHNEIRLNIDKIEVIMPRQEQVPRERYFSGDSIKAIILEVTRSNRDPEIIVSRRDISFVRRLFENEVPEIFDGIVEIKAIAREAGERTKIAVESNDQRIDPVGACVGMKGVRIQAIVKELNREKVDIIHWTDDRELMIRRAMAPVIPLDLVYLEGGNKVLAVIADEQVAQAIGRKGQNVRLASRLCDYYIEPVKASEYYQEELSLKEVEGLEPEWFDKLAEVGYNSAEEVLNDGLEEMMKLTELEADTADKIFEILNSYFEESE